ncbi:hypothetical protein [uncultured Sphingomonas sp.]|uniref:hypothetical protein n=1 Tax=uncultured Sphingomonas sp. TaxID=158754 RepID=UPI0037478538
MPWRWLSAPSRLRPATNISVPSAAAITAAPSTIHPVSPASHAASLPNVLNADCRPEPKMTAPPLKFAPLIYV